MEIPCPTCPTFSIPLRTSKKFQFTWLYFPDHLIDLVHNWYDDRYSSKGLFSNTPAHYLKVKIKDLEIFNVKDFLRAQIFPNYTMDFVHFWYDDRYRSKVLFSNTHCPCPWPQGQS